jgi:hypothetical protein
MSYGSTQRVTVHSLISAVLSTEQHGTMKDLAPVGLRGSTAARNCRRDVPFAGNLPAQSPHSGHAMPVSVPSRCGGANAHT